MNERRSDAWRPATRTVHAGLPAAEQGAPFLPGPVLAAPFHLAGEKDAAPYGYHRYGNPTWTAYEDALGELEGGRALVFPSGMAACAAVLQGLLGPGDVFVGPSDAYPGVRAIAEEHLAPLGVEVRLVPTSEEAVRAALPGATLVWVEVPSNPALDVLDLAALADDVHAAGALLAVDNTLATPLLTRPLELGADLAMAADTKGLTGHSDLVLGHVATRSTELYDRLLAWRGRVGAIAGPLETWLAHRSLATLDVRIARQSATALALATALESSPLVSGVRYPGLASHPAHEIAARQMDGRFGMVLGFDLPSAQVAQAFLASASLVAEATSFGGVHTSAERRARWGTDDVSEGFIRLSVGLEDPDDVVADVRRALDTASSSGTT